MTRFTPPTPKSDARKHSYFNYCEDLTTNRIASYHVENLFARPKAFDGSDWTIGEPILTAYEEVNRLFQKPIYDGADKARFTELPVILDICSINANGVARRKRSSNPRWAWLRKNQGSFYREPRYNTQSVVIIATGRDDWKDWG